MSKKTKAEKMSEKGEMVTMGEMKPKAVKVKLGKFGKKIWECIKKEGICRVTFADTMKEMDTCRAVISKMEKKFGEAGNWSSGVYDAGKSFGICTTPCPGTWIFMAYDRLPELIKM